MLNRTDLGLHTARLRRQNESGLSRCLEQISTDQDIADLREQLAAKDAEIAALKQENASLFAQAEEDSGVICRLKSIIAEERAQLEKADALAEAVDGHVAWVKELDPEQDVYVLVTRANAYKEAAMPNPERDKFNYFFRFLLHKCGDCFQRDVLRDNKEAMFASWEKYAKEWEEQESRRVQGCETPLPGGGK